MNVRSWRVRTDNALEMDGLCFICFLKSSLITSIAARRLGFQFSGQKDHLIAREASKWEAKCNRLLSTQGIAISIAEK